MVKPVAWWCPELADGKREPVVVHDSVFVCHMDHCRIPKNKHFSLYIGGDICKAWEEFANKLQKASESPSDYYSTKTLQGFAKTARRRAKEFE